MSETGYMTSAEDYFFTHNIEVLEQDSSGEFTFYKTNEGEFMSNGEIISKKTQEGAYDNVA